MAKVKFDDSGFRELQRKLRELGRTKPIAAHELFDRSFMSKHTRYDSLESMIQASGLAAESVSDEEGLRSNESWNRFIAENTRFRDWNHMVEAAAVEHVKRKLGFK